MLWSMPPCWWLRFALTISKSGLVPSNLVHLPNWGSEMEFTCSEAHLRTSRLEIQRLATGDGMSPQQTQTPKISLMKIKSVFAAVSVLSYSDFKRGFIHLKISHWKLMNYFLIYFVVWRCLGFPDYNLSEIRLCWPWQLTVQMLDFL